ncbi:MAG: hypothetical protein ABSD62_10895 [Candidatus Limnocylindrales bacterium]
MVERPLHPVCRVHLDELGDGIGVWQHAIGARPNRAFGYCTDDVARALQVDLLHSRSLGWPAIEASAWRSMAFLRDAFNAPQGRFRNFRSADGEWLDDVGSEDTHARALVALGTAIADAPDRRLAGEAARLFEAALPAARALTGPRPVAAAVLGCDAALRGGAQGEAPEVFRALATRLAGAFADLPSDWPWPDQVVTYENALLPRALIVAGGGLADETMLRLGCQALDWLAVAQTTDSGRLSLVGNKRWWPRGESPERFDQQPIDAASLLLAAEAAFVATGAERYRQLAEMAYGWFLGDNDLSMPVAIPATGGCHDGLTPDGVNLNQGAESTLMWLTALEHIRRLRAASRPREAAVSDPTSSVPQVSK